MVRPSLTLAFDHAAAESDESVERFDAEASREAEAERSWSRRSAPERRGRPGEAANVRQAAMSTTCLALLSMTIGVAKYWNSGLAPKTEAMRS